MPELVTHVLLGLVLAELFQVRKKSLVLLGAIIPDFFSKIVLLRLFLPLPHIDWGILSAFHTPFILVLFFLVLAPLFRHKYSVTAWGLTLGGISHILADTLLRHFGEGGIQLFYPLSSAGFRLNWIWPDQSYLLLYPLVMVYLFLVWRRPKQEWSIN